MKQICILIAAAACALGARAAATDTVVATPAYAWVGDSILQGPFRAYAVSPFEITGNYSARPGYYMGVDRTWKQKNDLRAYPRLKTPEKLLAAVYNMGLDEMVNAVEPDTTLRTGKEWAGVWTRDVSYSIILSMAALQPEASMISLRKKVDPLGRIVQDTGSGGAWPVSTDRMVWLLAAWEVYKVTGDHAWLEFAYRAGVRSMADDHATAYGPDGLVRGETSFIDWREQSYPRWMQTADIYRSEAMSTNVVHAAAMGILADMARQLGKRKEAADWAARSEGLARLINDAFYMPDKGYYGMYRYGRQNLVLLDREVPDLEVSSVVLNNRRAGYETTEALIRRGFTRIEMISYSMGLSNIREREEGYRRCMQAHEMGENAVIHHLRHDKFAKIEEIIREARQRRVEAFLFATNTLAGQGLSAIFRNGWRVPQDFAIACFDTNEAFDIYKTAIAYVRQPIERFGTEALDLLIKSIEQRDKPGSCTRIVLTPEIVESAPEEALRSAEEAVTEA